MKAKIIKYGNFYYIERGWWLFTEYLDVGNESYNWDHWWGWTYKSRGAFTTQENALKKWNFYKEKTDKGIEIIQVLK